MPLLYSIGKVTVGKAMTLGWRPHVEGIEHIPADIRDGVPFINTTITPHEPIETCGV